ncbi:hypothetical protein KR52_09615 [Synechococcus sp. KORDI-52]|uniref:hypothetical protein n=1 Tax=Synechococcus sp. KORDI-52 TaxID=585425 RepID=UPI0004E075B3|nr:hypothetical protein [Synechococcus sp. KORDI-52]AII49396.1 hypothetical protein KR52_09615 [Synechococcus sp. KORDI-52]
MRTAVENAPVRIGTENVENTAWRKSAAIMQKQSLINPMDRTLSDLVGSAVVFDLQQLLETYLPVVGNEGRNELIQTIRTAAMEYLDQ